MNLLHSMRVASNLLVAALLGGVVAFLLDVVLPWFGMPAPIGCTVLPAWQMLADPAATFLAIAGALIWLASGLRNQAGLWLLIIGLILIFGPGVFAFVTDPVC